MHGKAPDSAVKLLAEVIVRGKADNTSFVVPVEHDERRINMKQCWIVSENGYFVTFGS